MFFFKIINVIFFFFFSLRAGLDEGKPPCTDTHLSSGSNDKPPISHSGEAQSAGILSCAKRNYRKISTACWGYLSKKNVNQAAGPISDQAQNQSQAWSQSIFIWWKNQNIRVEFKNFCASFSLNHPSITSFLRSIFIILILLAFILIVSILYWFLFSYIVFMLPGIILTILILLSAPYKNILQIQFQRCTNAYTNACEHIISFLAQPHHEIHEMQEDFQNNQNIKTAPLNSMLAAQSPSNTHDANLQNPPSIKKPNSAPPLDPPSLISPNLRSPRQPSAESYSFSPGGAASPPPQKQVKNDVKNYDTSLQFSDDKKKGFFSSKHAPLIVFGSLFIVVFLYNLLGEENLDNLI